MSTPTLPSRIQTAIERRVAVITIAHPRRYNALTGEMLDELTTTLARLSVDPAVSVVLVTGSGPHSVPGWTSENCSRQERPASAWKIG